MEAKKEEMDILQNQLQIKLNHFQKIRDSMNSHVKLNIGGRVFDTSTSTLSKEDSMLQGTRLYFVKIRTVMFSGRFPLKPDEKGEYFIDRSPKHFERILSYLRTGSITLESLNEEEKEELLQEADYYRMEGLIVRLNGQEGAH